MLDLTSLRLWKSRSSFFDGKPTLLSSMDVLPASLPLGRDVYPYPFEEERNLGTRCHLFSCTDLINPF